MIVPPSWKRSSDSRFFFSSVLACASPYPPLPCQRRLRELSAATPSPEKGRRTGVFPPLLRYRGTLPTIDRPSQITPFFPLSLPISNSLLFHTFVELSNPSEKGEDALPSRFKELGAFPSPLSCTRCVITEDKGLCCLREIRLVFRDDFPLSFSLPSFFSPCRIT